MTVGVQRGGFGPSRATTRDQYHLDKKNLWKGDAFEMRSIQMPVTLATKAREGALDHPRIEAQASHRQATGAQICPQARNLGRAFLHSDQSELLDRLLHDFDGMTKAQAIGVEILFDSGLVHQEAQAMVQEQHAVELLQHALRTATA